MASKQEQLAPEAFRLWLIEKQSIRQVAAALSIGKNTAQKYIDAELAASQPSSLSERTALVAESIGEKDAVWRAAHEAFTDADAASLNRGSYLNTMLAASIAKDRVRGLLKELVEVSGRDGAPIWEGLARELYEQDHAATGLDPGDADPQPD